MWCRNKSQFPWMFVQLFSISCSARALTSPQASGLSLHASVPVCKMGRNCTSLIKKGSAQQMLQYQCLMIKRSNTDCTKSPATLFVWNSTITYIVSSSKTVGIVAHNYNILKKILKTCNLKYWQILLPLNIHQRRAQNIKLTGQKWQ